MIYLDPEIMLAAASVILTVSDMCVPVCARACAFARVGEISTTPACALWLSVSGHKERKISGCRFVV